MRCGCLLLNPPPSDSLPAEGRESEGHEIGSLMTTHERLHPQSKHSGGVRWASRHSSSTQAEKNGVPWEKLFT